MDGKTTLKYLQNYIKAKDFKPELKTDYFFKLSEEVGELAKAMRKGIVYEENGNIKGTMESTIKIKEEINNKKYNTGIEFEEKR